MPKLMEVLEFLDDSGETMAKRLPEDSGTEIKWGAQLTVRESQKAIFFRDGQSLDVFGPGRYVLKTQNIPLVTKAITSLGYGTDSPFRSEVYFLNMKLFPNLKWGTSEPILFHDSELKMIRLRAHGSFSIQIQDPTLFLNKVVGTQGIYTDQHISDYLRSIIVSKLTTVLGKELTTVFELPANFDNLSVIIRNSIKLDFDGLGLSMHDLYIGTISVPEEVQKLIDTRSGMSAVGDMNEFMKYQMGISIEKAAESTGGGAGMGLGMGAGIGMGMMMPQMIQEAMKSDDSSQTQKKESQDEDPFEQIKKLKELLDMGALSEVEFEEAKKKFLGGM